MRTESAVEPTRSENITVTCRRSAVFFPEVSIAERASAGGIFAFASARRVAMPLSSLRRCPTITTPKSFKSSAVKLGRSEFVDRVLAKCRLILFKTETPQPISNVHDGASRQLLRELYLVSCPQFVRKQIIADEFVQRGCKVVGSGNETLRSAHLHQAREASKTSPRSRRGRQSHDRYCPAARSKVENRGHGRQCHEAALGNW